MKVEMICIDCREDWGFYLYENGRKVSQNSTRKKRKHRKRNVNRQISPAGEVTLIPNSSENDITALVPNPSENCTSMYQQKIGKMVVTGKEIGKGSNGTIVLEGEYDSRSVAVKRMLMSFNNVAQKEMDYLIESDRHLNIIRWYEVEYDQDFVYLCLERCMCTLFDLIRLRTSLDQGQVLLESEIQLLRSLESDEELVLWKNNDYPSALMLNLMSNRIRSEGRLLNTVLEKYVYCNVAPLVLLETKHTLDCQTIFKAVVITLL
ncbi:hypothetical protein C2S52_016264 [Perilla frutescens var. hirtella]|nr:hypothetical protein C2S52_016264 [Perilla frutescens var. hirtella]